MLRALPYVFQVRYLNFMARVAALSYIDTRILSILSGVVNVTWVLAVFIPYIIADSYPSGFLSRIVFGAPYEYIIGPLFLMGCCEIFSAIMNNYRGRFYCSIASVAWWTWLTGMSFAVQPNETAGWMFGIIAIFRGWTFVTLSNTHSNPERMIDRG
jgi:hypothetical protein